MASTPPSCDPRTKTAGGGGHHVGRSINKLAPTEGLSARSRESPPEAITVPASLIQRDPQSDHAFAVLCLLRCTFTVRVLVEHPLLGWVGPVLCRALFHR